MYRAALVFLLLLSACSWERRVNKLTDTEFQHYYALKPFMTDDELMTFARTRAETPLEVELLNRLETKMYGDTAQDFEKQMVIVFGEPLK